MRERRRLVFPLVTACAVFAASACAPNDQAQTVSFVLSLHSPRVNRVEFVVHYDDGKFAGTDGQCVVSAVAGPRATNTSEAQLLAKDAEFGLTRKQVRMRRIEVMVGEAPTTTEVSSTSTSTTTTSTIPSGNGTCGDRVIDRPAEECDDGDQLPGDGCSATCHAEFAFTSIDNDVDELRITIVNGLGIPPGASLAFCKFQGDVADADFEFVTASCDSAHGGTCNTDRASVTVSTTTTTTTTTTSSTTTTTGGGDSTTTSSTQP